MVGKEKEFKELLITVPTEKVKISGGDVVIVIMIIALIADEHDDDEIDDLLTDSR